MKREAGIGIAPVWNRRGFDSSAVKAYLQRVGARPAYQRAMTKGDPDLSPMLT